MSDLTPQLIKHRDGWLWKEWWSIYLDAFPAEERMSEDFFIQTMVGQDEQNGVAQAIYAFTTDGLADPSISTSEVVAISYHETYEESRFGWLYYIAVKSSQRGLGVGSEVYKWLADLIASSGCEFFFYEVELPSGDPGAIPDRRIAWYKRQGAEQLDGIQYYQSTDISDAKVPMALLVHRFSGISVQDVYSRLREALGESLTKTGRLKLV
jgi:hypothetical protein